MIYEVVRYNKNLIKYGLDIDYICFIDRLLVVKNTDATAITELGNIQYWDGRSMQLYVGSKNDVYFIIPKGTFEAVDGLVSMGEVDSDWYPSSIYKFYAAIIATCKVEQLPKPDMK